MGTITIKVSDLSGEQIPDENQAARLIVEHPEFDEPIGLDILADEVAPHLTDENTRFVVVYLEDPDSPNPQRHVLSIDDFNRLFQSGESESVLQQAFETQQQEREAAALATRGSGKRGAASGSTRTHERIDYSSPEHAGKPHRGTISEAEKEYVRNNLDAVNRRNREQGYPEIDPSDQRTAARYELTPQTTNGGPSDTDTTR